MIILAAAIILSLSNSGIISKANKAKTDSDTANLKEYVNTLRAEWELMTADEQTAEGSFEAYANKKLEKSGYKGAVGADGEVYSNLNENAMAAIRAGIKVGDTVTGYTVTSTTYETSGEENTAPNNTETDPTKQTNSNNKYRYNMEILRNKCKWRNGNNGKLVNNNGSCSKYKSKIIRKRWLLKRARNVKHNM